MLIKDEMADFAVYTTKESEGRDICIKDSIGRYFVLSRQNIPELIEALYKIHSNNEDYSVLTSFEML